jgi:membrane-associated phospholipid phosphatase
MIASLAPFRSIKRIDGICTVLAFAAIVVAAPVDVRAQDGAPARMVDADDGAPPNLFRTTAQRPQPFQSLFVHDADWLLAIRPTAPDWSIDDATRFAVESDPRHSALRSDLQGVQAQKPAEPAHTGFKALLFETASDFNAYPRRQSTWVILGIGGAAAALAHPVDDEVNGKLAGSDAAGKFFAAGKYIGSWYTQVGVATGLYVVGRYVLPHAEGARRTNRVSHIGFDMVRALIVSQTLTQGIKIAVRRDRPTGECCAFPSGHASATFATAAVIERHFGYRGSWPMFLIASYVATSRLHDNRHFLSDVLFGAAVGVSSGWTVVGRHGRSQFALTPVPIRGGMMIALTRQPPTPYTR